MAIRLFHLNQTLENKLLTEIARLNDCSQEPVVFKKRQKGVKVHIDTADSSCLSETAEAE